MNLGKLKTALGLTPEMGNLFKSFGRLVASAAKVWYNDVLYVILIIGVWADWDSVRHEGGLTLFALIILAYTWILQYQVKKRTEAENKLK